MPGLRVTYEQAQRLWGLDATTCREVLDCLIQLKFLTLTPSRQYVRLTEGATSGPDMQMVKAVLESTQTRKHAG